MNALAISRTDAVGAVVAFWCWALDNVPEDGSLRGVEPADLVDILEMPAAKIREIVKGMVRAGFIDRDGQGSGWRDLRIHDWEDYTAFHYANRRRERDRKRAQRAKHRESAQSIAEDAQIAAERRSNSADLDTAVPPQPTVLTDSTNQPKDHASVPSEPPGGTPTERFYRTTKTNEQVAALVDIATANGRDLDGGHTATMLRKHPPPDVLKALMTAIGENAARLDTRMERVLGNVNRRTGQDGYGNARRGTQRVVTREEVLRDADKF